MEHKPFLKGIAVVLNNTLCAIGASCIIAYLYILKANEFPNRTTLLLIAIIATAIAWKLDDWREEG